jgi:predicted permease
LIAALLHDLRFGVRALGRQKTLSLAAIATLAVCIGAATTIFSIVNAVVLRPLPFPEPDRLAFIHNSYPRAGVDLAGSGVPDYYDCRAETGLFDEVALFRSRGQTIGAGGDAERRTMMTMTPSLFRLLRAKPLMGRAFTEEDAEIGNDRKIILSYELWQRLLGGDPAAVGRDVRINEVPYTVVGIMPAGFRFWSADVTAWIPAAFSAADRSDQARHSNSYQMVARLKSGVGFDLAQQRIDALGRRNLERLPAIRQILIDAGFRTFVLPLQEYLVRDVRGTLYLLWGGSLFVLVIGCVNIANLALVRASGRMKELATRYALGASLGHLARQTVTEAVIVGAIGGALGLVLGRWGLALVRTLGLERLPRAFEIAFDMSVVVYTLVLVAAISVFVGLVPMASLRSRALGQAIREEGRSGTASRGARIMRRGLVTVQVALALVLLAGAALLFASFHKLLAEDPGFRVERVWTGVVNLPTARYGPDESIVAFQARLLERLKAVPGVAAAGLTDTIPFGPGSSDSVIFAEGVVPKPGESIISAYQTRITPGYFETIGVRLLRGRLFEERDAAASPRVIVVDDRLAARFWPGADPIGKRMWQPADARALPPTDDTQFLTVVGVVNTIRMRTLSGEGERLGAVYHPMTQAPSRTLILTARSGAEPAALTAAIRAEVKRLDVEIPLSNVRTMIERRDQVMETRRMPLVLSVVFGAVALFLAAIGLYGVLAYQVTQRSREIGIRMALGGRAAAIVRLVLGEGLVMVATGGLLGLAGILAMGRILESQLFGVRPSDPLIITGIVCVVGLVALAACLVPARRAAAINPVRALNEL